MAVENLHLPQVCDNQQLTVPENPWRGRHSDYRAAPADPLGDREGEYRPGLPDIEIVEAVEQWAGDTAALE